MAIVAGAKLAASDVNVFHQQQVGTQSVTFTTATSNSTTVTFLVAFAAAPMVNPPNIDTAPGVTASWRARAISITTTGFVIFSEGPSAAWAGQPVSWNAVAR
jgi:hypothetical protein